MLRQHLDITLWRVETASYTDLDLRSISYPHWIISHVLVGNVITTSGGQTFAVPQGSVMVHPPGLLFSEFALTPGTHQWMLFDATVSSNPGPYLDYLTRTALPPVVSLQSQQDTFTRTFIALDRAYHRGNELSAVGYAVLLLDILTVAWQEAGKPVQPPGFSPPAHRFAELIAYMEAHLGERLTRDDLALRACLHPGSFDRAFRAACGIPPMKMLQQMRLARARRYLETTNDTVETIARACGFSEGTHFSRLFRAHFGTTPGQVRAAARATATAYLSGLPL